MELLVYWEKQDPKTKLCALHCLNSTLQGPVVTADELCEISTILDSKENMLLNFNGESGYNGKVLGYGNVSELGDFNLPVLQSALSIRNISCEHFSLSQLSLGMFQHNDSIGFICNIQEHWFSIRKLHGEWCILDSLRDGPVLVEYGWLHDYIKEILETSRGVVFLVIPNNGKFPEPDPFTFSNLQPHQFFFKLSELSHENKSFLYKNGNHKISWPTTGGIRLDQSNTQEDADEYNGSDAIRIAIKLITNERLTKSFSPNHSINKLFEWLETKCDLKEHDFYFLIQTAPYRKFIKYTNGSIELLTNSNSPREVTNETFNKLDFTSNDMLMLRIN